MTDRELLELAAKAAGIAHVTPMMIEWGQWNPLTYDGDALRLAVELRMAIDIGGGGFAQAVCGEPECAEAQEDISLDPYAATRRAIVRAAADLWKGVA